ncbi:MAG: hypothetical protein ABI679_10955 [Gemmatimonadota bacterium]
MSPPPGLIPALADRYRWLVFDTEESAMLFRLTAPNQRTRLGVIPRAIRSIQVSRDLKRASVNVREYRGDAWIAKLIRQ